MGVIPLPKMQAAVVEQFGQPLVLREWAITSPGHGQILVKTEACGVCHTDLHAAHGDWPMKPILPFIPGHEGIGRVAAVGSGVTAVKEGDRVGVPWLYSACGHCENCLSAWETVCVDAQFGGFTKNMKQDMKFSGLPAKVAIAKILEQYQDTKRPEKHMVIVVDEAKKLILVTTQASCDKNKLTPFDVTK